jgi:transposase
MTHNQAVFGVDVAKAALVIGRYGHEGRETIANDAAAIATWLATLPAGSVVAMEATGAYHRMLATLAHGAGMQVYVLNPQALRHYAPAIGLRGKTDRVDAQLIARYAMHEQARLRPWAPPPAGSDRLSELLVRRQVLVGARQRIAQSLSGISALKAQRETLLAQLQRMIARVERLIGAELARDPTLAALHRRLATIVGVGPIVAAQLVASLARLRFERADAFIAYTGLDPRPDDSGTRRGRRRLTHHGHALLRCLLFNAAMAATHSKLFKPRYLELRARGLQSTEAIVVLARKIARIAFALYKSGETFDAQRHLKIA